MQQDSVEFGRLMPVGRVAGEGEKLDEGVRDRLLHSPSVPGREVGVPPASEDQRRDLDLPEHLQVSLRQPYVQRRVGEGPPR